MFFIGFKSCPWSSRTMDLQINIELGGQLTRIIAVVSTQDWGIDWSSDEIMPQREVERQERVWKSIGKISLHHNAGDRGVCTVWSFIQQHYMRILSSPEAVQGENSQVPCQESSYTGWWTELRWGFHAFSCDTVSRFCLDLDHCTYGCLKVEWLNEMHLGRPIQYGHRRVSIWTLSLIRWQGLSAHLAQWVNASREIDCCTLMTWQLPWWHLMGSVSCLKLLFC